MKIASAWLNVERTAAAGSGPAFLTGLTAEPVWHGRPAHADAEARACRPCHKEGGAERSPGRRIARAVCCPRPSWLIWSAVTSIARHRFCVNVQKRCRWRGMGVPPMLTRKHGRDARATRRAARSARPAGASHAWFAVPGRPGLIWSAVTSIARHRFCVNVAKAVSLAWHERPAHADAEARACRPCHKDGGAERSPCRSTNAHSLSWRGPTNSQKNQDRGGCVGVSFE